jgi:hypothetical protein
MAVRIRLVGGLALALVGAHAAVPLLAADSRLDDAVAHLVKVRTLVEAAEPSGAGQDYTRHAKRAEDLIDRVIHEINLAKRSADAAPTGRLNQPPSTGKGITLNPSGPLKLNPQPEPPLPQAN